VKAPQFLIWLLGAAALAAAPPPAPAPVPTVITSDDMDAYSTADKTVSIYTHHVVVTGNNTRVDCDRLELITTRVKASTGAGDKPAQFQYLLATGHVRIVQGDREATCGRAEVRPDEDKITLTENPVVIDHSDNTVVTGDKLVMLHKEGRVTGTHMKIVGPPIKSLGLEKATPEAAPSKGNPPP
jgi:lipopolysaccharide export system protein LptA